MLVLTDKGCRTGYVSIDVSVLNSSNQDDLYYIIEDDGYGYYVKVDDVLTMINRLGFSGDVVEIEMHYMETLCDGTNGNGLIINIYSKL